jgi:alkylated DNA repair dioxygenase AlkB
MLDSAPDWTFHIRRNGTEHAISLDAGDAAIYSGTQDLHWRNAMPQKHDSVLGVFFHFVPADYQGSLD